jgi:predicted ATPase
MSSPASLIWTEDEARLLLQNPVKLFLKEDHWRSWIFKRGGLNSVYAQLLKLNFSSSEHEVLDLIISAPGLDAKNYASTLCVDRATYYRHLKSLLKKLTVYLNASALDLIESVPVRSESSFQGIAPNVPVPVYPIIGRDNLIQSVSNLLIQPDVRVLTLTGPGGIGKTRLALHLAHQLHTSFRDGVIFVELASVLDTDLVISAIAKAIGVSEGGSQPFIEQIKSYFMHKHILLICDNFEHVISAGTIIGELIAYSPALQVLVTSRELLRIYGEQEYVIPPLELPEPQDYFDTEKLAIIPSVSLFVQRASSYNSRFRLTDENATIIAEICTRLDGLPLAIELITARTKYFSVQALLIRLKDSLLSVLTSGSKNLPQRQQTLRTAIQWSYDLLIWDEQRIFCRVSVFRGGCTIAMVDEICNINNDIDIDITDVLISLTDKSLLQQREQDDGEPHFFMLETLREFAFECLIKQGDLNIIQERFAQYSMEFVKEAVSRLQTDMSSIKMLEQEQDNIRAVLKWSVQSQENAHIAIQMCGYLWYFWYIRGIITEGRDWFYQVLKYSDHCPIELRARAFDGAGVLAMINGDYEKALYYHDASLQMYTELGDEIGIIGNIESLGAVHLASGNSSRARDFFEKNFVMQKEKNDLDGMSSSMINLGVVGILEKNYGLAESYMEKALSIAQERGNIHYEVVTLQNLGSIAYHQGYYDHSMHLYKESLRVNRDLGNKDSIANCLEGFGLVFIEINELEKATLFLSTVAHLRETFGLRTLDANLTLIDNAIAKLQSLLGESWKESWSRGKLIDIDELITELIVDDGCITPKE